MRERDDGVIEQLTLQRTRPRREPPKHRPAAGAARPVSIAAPTPPDVAESAAAGRGHADEHSDERQGVIGEAAEGRDATSPASEPLRLAADEPLANYAVRVRRTLDDLLAWRLAQMRRHGIRTSKVEITELLLWELAQADLDQIARRLQVFREHAPR